MYYARPGKKLEPGDGLFFGDRQAPRVEAKDGADIKLRFDAQGADLLETIDALGHMPLPPYIRRAKGGENGDREDYRTFCGRKMGSLAAPTASLHFDEETLESLRTRAQGRRDPARRRSGHLCPDPQRRHQRPQDAPRVLRAGRGQRRSDRRRAAEGAAWSRSAPPCCARWKACAGRPTR